jgi:DNA-binding NtrC family response regulator
VEKCLLVLDDEALMLEAVQMALGSKYRLLLTSSYSQAVQALDTEEVDGALIDIDLGSAQQDGKNFLEIFKKRHPDKPALMVSGHREIATVVQCMKIGADDYVEKPFDGQTLDFKVDRVFSSALKQRVYKRAYEKSAAQSQVVGRDMGLLRAKQLVEEAFSLRILILGETGVGKTPFARYSNQILSEATGQLRPFEQLNCACLSVDRFQDQLFGHKKGAFTGAVSDARGLVELAKGGDLFLDEVGEMPLEAQAMFLTFLDSGEYYRMGDDVKRKAEVRIIAATNRDLKRCVEKGTFRKDLYSRLAQVVVTIPPLRERPSDIPLLLEYFITKYAGFPKPYDPEVLTLLREQTWEEGNVREFQDAIEHICMRARHSPCIEMEHVPSLYVSLGANYAPLHEGGAEEVSQVLHVGLESYLDGHERRILEQCLEKYRGTIDDMAKELKVSRPTLYRRLKRHQIRAKESLLN